MVFKKLCSPIILMVLFLCSFSCQQNKKPQNADKNNLSSIIDSIDIIKHNFSLEDIGTEGNEGTAYYVDKRLQKIEMNIYTSMWKIRIIYFFFDKHINVTEQTYNTYETIKLIKSLSYTIDLNGIPIENVDSNRVDIFHNLIKTVPYTLK